MKMKKVRFDELPKEVQDFLDRVFGCSFKYSCTFELDWLHNLKKWKDASDEERLAYAEWKFIGREVICLIDNNKLIVECLDRFDVNYALWAVGYKIINGEQDHGWSVLLYKDDRWAEIVEEPELTHEPKIDWSKANKDNIPVEDEPEFKSGDEVIEDIIVGAFYKYHGNERDMTKGNIYYVYYSNSDYIELFDDYNQAHQFTRSEYHLFELIQLNPKPDPDKHLKEIAQELIEKYVKGTACSGGCGILKPYKIHSYIFEDNGLESMLIEALKKGKSL